MVDVERQVPCGWAWLRFSDRLLVAGYFLVRGHGVGLTHSWGLITPASGTLAQTGTGNTICKVVVVVVVVGEAAVWCWWCCSWWWWLSDGLLGDNGWCEVCLAGSRAGFPTRVPHTIFSIKVL